MYIRCVGTGIQNHRVGRKSPNIVFASTAAYFCYLLSDNYVDLSDLYVDLSVIYVDLSEKR